MDRLDQVVKVNRDGQTVGWRRFLKILCGRPPVGVFTFGEVRNDSPKLRLKLKTSSLMHERIKKIVLRYYLSLVVQIANFANIKWVVSLSIRPSGLEAFGQALIGGTHGDPT